MRSWRSIKALLLLDDASPDRLSRIIELAPISVFVTWINVAILGFAYIDYIPSWPFWIWQASFIVVGLIVIRSWSRLHLRRFTRISRKAVRASTLLCMFVATPWWLMVFMILPYVPSMYQMLGYLVMAGMAAGGGLLLARAPLSALAYMGMMLVPIMMNVLINADSFHLTMLAFSIIYLSFLALFVLHQSVVLLVNDQSRHRMAEQMAQIKLAKQSIERLAKIDPVTELYNRAAFKHALAHALDDIKAGQLSTLTLFLLDLDHFKSVNDALGHHAGDLYLSETAQRIRSVTNDQQLLFRIGGDEFAILAYRLTNELDVVWLGQRLIAALSQPIMINGHHLQGGASIGIAQAPKHTMTASELLTLADDALFDAKASGRGILTLFDIAKKDRIKDLALEAEKLARGISSGQIVMAYQPQIHLSSGALLGFEALVRWRHPDKGVLTPDHFLTLAEDKGLMLELCHAIMQTVHTDLVGWLRAGLDPGRISINIHPLQLKHPGRFLQKLRDIAADCDSPARLCVEITEDCIVGRGTEEVPHIMKGLLQEGFSVSLDDFGTGFASLSHIKELPISELKIDRSFTHDMLSCEKSLTIVQAVYDMAKPCNIEVVAEGIETQEQAEALMRFGGTLGQGFFYAKPMMVAEVTAALTARRWRLVPVIAPHKVVGSKLA